ncbi:MAG TPA: rhomboid family intramembrane serine protease [Chitinophagaceae bacterium]|nr:rhomboid family intramembrane serine protease [Chitinophagaceae bacterium]
MNQQYYRPNSFPPVVKNLIIINVLVYIAQEAFGSQSQTILNLFALHDVHSVFFKPYQLITYMFLHGGIDHILFNMIALWMFGALLENHWGAKRFLTYYLLCGLGAGVLHLIVLYFQMAPLMEEFHSASSALQLEYVNSPNFRVNEPTLGASGAIFGCLAAFGYLFPNSLIYVYFLIPIKAKWFVFIYGALELTLAVRNSAGDNVAHFAHLGGAITGLIIVFFWNKTNRKTLY